ncbi:MAG: DUF2059 domain-containing protein [Neisseria sicca]|uniref:DUF2059 domain-containing protein n=1 Tax=Neisseria sicca TaxID=490 RepID=A0A930GVK7_NEISI|nr:DUF2059 domain-containing protein [Neisseria sicca]MBF1264269.1 DUF2059 domain-containing protein [Neisseria sicca]MDU4437676.1 DUF2059 domain-containing protein [Neisseria sp.]
MKLKTLLLPVAALALCANAFAAPPSDASLERLFEVQKMDALLYQSFQSMEGIVLSDPNVQKFLKDAPEDKRPQLEAVLKKYANQSIAEINTPQVRAQLRKATMEGIKTVLTQEEVDALIGFYGTEVGQSILDKMPRYLEATMNPTMNIIAEKYEKSNQNEKLVREILQIMCSGKNPAPACSTQPQKPARRK